VTVCEKNRLFLETKKKETEEKRKQQESKRTVTYHEELSKRKPT
jgi:hypothetical protein